MKLTLGFSTCPNDTYIFDAMIHRKIDTEGLEFEVVMADVEELNRNAFEGSIDITKLSYHAYAYIANTYRLLTSGSALGRGNGPLLISKKEIKPVDVRNMRVAIPGKNTTGNLLFSIFYPEINDKPEYLFSDIEDAILDGKVDAGVIIHENRFTYQKRGLHQIVDLGEKWEKETNSPIPLGGIVIHRKYNNVIQQKVNRVLKRSLQFAFDHPGSSYSFVKKYAQEMEEEVMRSHISLYVNDFSFELGEEGKRAIKTLYEEALKNGIISAIPDDIFVY